MFISSELRARSLDERALEIIKSGNFTLTTKKTCVVNGETLNQVMLGQSVALEPYSSGHYLSPLKSMNPVVDQQKLVVFGDSIVELSNYDSLNGLDHCLTRGTDREQAGRRHMDIICLL
jgi:hypothetical protein